MNENIMIEIQYAISKTGNKRVPIEISILEDNELLFSSAIYASEKMYHIPQNMQKACRNAPGIESIRMELEAFGLPAAV